MYGEAVKAIDRTMREDDNRMVMLHHVMRGRRASGMGEVDGLACDARREPLPPCRRVCAAACDVLRLPLQLQSNIRTIIFDFMLHPLVRRRRSAVSQVEEGEAYMQYWQAMVSGRKKRALPKK